ncbi:hypothetical protein Goari_003070 [Gossypium aridum]|uniref:Protein kinase domain-containing protein n=1 Tax=Gossypium aridum TaxID=34290 RepID=A0A7J8YBV7_GOSAI|nr:hypothetical protein [Gossypium aridum]
MVKATTGDFHDNNELRQEKEVVLMHKYELMFSVSCLQGKLKNGQEIVVRRLSKHSSQGELKFRNEILLVAKLQHRNLVSLLGFCLEGTKKILVYNGYMAPEYAVQGQFLIKCDVFSSGVLLLETVIGKRNIWMNDSGELDHLPSYVSKRPTMASVVLILNTNSLSLPPPLQPTFLMYGNMLEADLSTSDENSRSNKLVQSRDSDATPYGNFLT